MSTLAARLCRFVDFASPGQGEQKMASRSRGAQASAPTSPLHPLREPRTLAYVRHEERDAVPISPAQMADDGFAHADMAGGRGVWVAPPSARGTYDLDMDT